MAFIDNTYFVGEIAVPNQTGTISNATAIIQAIGQYEKEILISLLGYKLYSLLIADLDAEGLPQTQPFIDLVDGAEFEINGILLKWNGLKNSDKQSLIAYYTYYKMIERETVHNSGIGAILAKGEKGNRVSPVNKMINAWDRMRELYGKSPKQFDCIGYLTTTFFNFEPSAHNFLFANKESYPDWRFTPIWGINSFGI